jgi:DNA-binding NtrC family response regulator
VPALALIDFDLPGMNGERFLRRLRKEHADMPAIMISGVADIGDMPDDTNTTLLTKPFEMNMLARLVVKLLNSRTRGGFS